MSFYKKMMQIILYLYDKCKTLIAHNLPISVLRKQGIFDKITSIKYDVANDQLSLLDDYFKQIDDFYNTVKNQYV